MKQEFNSRSQGHDLLSQIKIEVSQGQVSKRSLLELTSSHESELHNALSDSRHWPTTSSILEFSTKRELCDCSLTPTRADVEGYGYIIPTNTPYLELPQFNIPGIDGILFETTLYKLPTGELIASTVIDPSGDGNFERVDWDNDQQALNDYVQGWFELTSKFNDTFLNHDLPKNPGHDTSDRLTVPSANKEIIGIFSSNLGGRLLDHKGCPNSFDDTKPKINFRFKITQKEINIRLPDNSSIILSGENNTFSTQDYTITRHPAGSNQQQALIINVKYGGTLNVSYNGIRHTSGPCQEIIDIIDWDKEMLEFLRKRNEELSS